jgi:hypothetical protein
MQADACFFVLFHQFVIKFPRSIIIEEFQWKIIMLIFIPLKIGEFSNSKCNDFFQSSRIFSQSDQSFEYETDSVIHCPS